MGIRDVLLGTLATLHVLLIASLVRKSGLLPVRLLGSALMRSLRRLKVVLGDIVRWEGCWTEVGARPLGTLSLIQLLVMHLGRAHEMGLLRRLAGLRMGGVWRKLLTVTLWKVRIRLVAGKDLLFLC